MVKKKKLGYGLYEYKSFTISKNEFGEYGLPKTGWKVNEPDGDEIGAVYTLKQALKWIDSLLR
jgi:hypothetical protein